MNTLNTPILFLIFNRLDTAKKVFETIKKINPQNFISQAMVPELISKLKMKSYSK